MKPKIFQFLPESASEPLLTDATEYMEEDHKQFKGSLYNYEKGAFEGDLPKLSLPVICESIEDADGQVSAAVYQRQARAGEDRAVIAEVRLPDNISATALPGIVNLAMNCLAESLAEEEDGGAACTLLLHMSDAGKQAKFCIAQIGDTFAVEVSGEQPLRLTPWQSAKNTKFQEAFKLQFEGAKGKLKQLELELTACSKALAENHSKQKTEGLSEADSAGLQDEAKQLAQEYRRLDFERYSYYQNKHVRLEADRLQFSMGILVSGHLAISGSFGDHLYQWSHSFNRYPQIFQSEGLEKVVVASDGFDHVLVKDPGVLHSADVNQLETLRSAGKSAARLQWDMYTQWVKNTYPEDSPSNRAETCDSQASRQLDDATAIVADVSKLPEPKSDRKVTVHPIYAVLDGHGGERVKSKKIKGVYLPDSSTLKAKSDRNNPVVDHAAAYIVRYIQQQIILTANQSFFESLIDAIKNDEGWDGLDKQVNQIQADLQGMGLAEFNILDCLSLLPSVIFEESKSWMTPLQYAIHCNNENAIEWLLKNGAALITELGPHRGSSLQEYVQRLITMEKEPKYGSNQEVVANLESMQTFLQELLNPAVSSLQASSTLFSAPSASGEPPAAESQERATSACTA